MGCLDTFRVAMSQATAPVEPAEVAQLLDGCVSRACAGLGLQQAEIYCGGQTLTMFLTPRHPWEAIVIGPDAFQLYPGFLRDDGETIVWANVWIADNYTLEKFVAVMEQELQRAAQDAPIP